MTELEDQTIAIVCADGGEGRRRFIEALIEYAENRDDADVVVGHHSDTEYVVPTNAPKVRAVRKGQDRFFRS